MEQEVMLGTEKGKGEIKKNKRQLFYLLLIKYIHISWEIGKGF